jgi:outer membrane protein
VARFIKHSFVKMTVVIAGVVFSVASYAVTPSPTLTLKDLYARALQNDPVYLQAKADNMEQQQTLPIARSAFLPQLSSSDMLKSNYDKGSLPGFSVNITQPLFDWHAFKKIDQAAKLTVLSQTELKLAKQDLLRRLVSACLDLYAAQEEVEIAGKQVKRIKSQLNNVIGKLNEKAEKSFNKHQVESSYNLYRAELMSAQLRSQQKLQALVLMVGPEKLNDLVPMLQVEGLFSQMQLDNQVWVKSGDSSNLSLQLARENVAIARAAVAVETANYIPTVAFAGSYYPDRYYQQPGNKHFMYGFNVSFANLNAGATHFKIQQARAAVVKSSVQNAAQKVQVDANIKNAYQAVVTSHQQILVQKTAVDLNVKALRGITEVMKAGDATIMDLIELNDKLFSSRKAYLSGRMQYMRSLLALKFNAGLLTKDISLKDIVLEPKMK